jgi:hypothetical protein
MKNARPASMENNMHRKQQSASMETYKGRINVKLNNNKRQ